jgi:hypothetical protein
MANEQERPAKPKGSGKKTASNVLISIGVIGNIISIVIFIVGCCQPPEPESLIYVFIGIPGVVISSCISLIGFGLRPRKDTK